MFRDPEQRGRSIGAIVLIGIGLLALVNNFLSGAVVAWLWIIGLAAAAAAFTYAYRQQGESWAAIGAYVTGAIAALVFLVTQIELSGNTIPILVMLGIAAPFVYAWSRNREEWGLLVPAYVMVAIAFFLLWENSASDNAVVTYVMFVIGLPFVVAALYSRTWPLLIPGGIMWAIAVVFLVSALETAGSLVNVIVALGLIIGGGWMLFDQWRGDKPKREE